MYHVKFDVPTYYIIDLKGEGVDFAKYSSLKKQKF